MQKKKNKSQIKNNGFALKALLGTFGIFAVGLLVFFIVDLIMPFGRHPGMMQIRANVFLLKIILSIAILGFSLYLIFDYLRSYLQVKNEMLLGVLLSIIAFMMFAISTNPIMQFMFRQDGNGVFSVIPLVFAAAALGTLAWVSSK